MLASSFCPGGNTSPILSPGNLIASCSLAIRFPSFPLAISWSSLRSHIGWMSNCKQVKSVTHYDDSPHKSALCLDQFLKLRAIVETGGQAKLMIQDGQVKVNGDIETRRRRKLGADDVVEVNGRKWPVKDSASSR